MNLLKEEKESRAFSYQKELGRQMLYENFLIPNKTCSLIKKKI